MASFFWSMTVVNCKSLWNFHICMPVQSSSMTLEWIHDASVATIALATVAATTAVCIHRVVMAAGHSILPLSFRSFFFRRLISDIAWLIVAKLCHTFDGDPDLWNSVRNLDAPETWRPKNINISARFRTLRLDREYLRNATRSRQSENSVANYGHSRIGKLNSVYFGLQTVKTGPEFWPSQ